MVNFNIFSPYSSDLIGNFKESVQTGFFYNLQALPAKIQNNHANLKEKNPFIETTLFGEWAIPAFQSIGTHNCYTSDRYSRHENVLFT